MQKRTQARLIALATFAVVASLSGVARAHFMLVAPSSWWSQASDGSPQKVAPCGNEATTGTAATGAVNVYQPGQTITVTVAATVPHPGWWRISLREGKSSTQVAATFPDPMPLGAAGSAQQCTPAFINNPVWSATQPVLLDKLGLPAGSISTTTIQSGTQSFPVTIPASARCTTASPCTLQVLMLMTDHPAGSCNYHHCMDMVPAAGAGDGGVTGMGGAAGGGAAGGRTGTDAGAAAGGTTGNNGAGGSTTASIGGSTGSTPMGGTTGGSVAGNTGSTGLGGATGGGLGGSSAGTDGGPQTPGGESASCGCVTGGRTGFFQGGAALVLFGLLLTLRRRRR